jgi:hypothetical protein
VVALAFTFQRWDGMMSRGTAVMARSSVLWSNVESAGNEKADLIFRPAFQIIALTTIQTS